jgi:hypothetical protein
MPSRSSLPTSGRPSVMSTRPDQAGEAARPRVLMLATRDDDPARMLADRLGEGTVVISPQDLSRPGWTYARKPSLRTGVSRHGRFRADDLTAVVSRISAIQPVDLTHVRTGDRDYVAAEMTAFLRAWLTGLPCPVVNPPTSTCLSGPALTDHQWVVLCNQLSVPVRPARHTVPAAPGHRHIPAACRVTICRGVSTATGPCSAVLLEHARRLAAQVRVEWLAVLFDGDDHQAAACQVQTWPDLADPAIREALVHALTGSGAGS